MKPVALSLSILIAQSAGIIGSLATFNSVDTWYQTLTLPSIAPPSWIFGPVWITLYTLMGIAAYQIWMRRKEPGATKGLIVYGIHLILNALWSILFFGLQSPGWAFLEILVLLAAILYTTALFYRIDHIAGHLMLPYIAWVLFASKLNYLIWILNY